MAKLYLTALVLVCFHYFAVSDFQGDALYAFKKALNATSSQLGDWNLNHVNPCSSWSNIMCNGNNVTAITLPTMGFTGTLSPEIAVIKSLSTLNLEGNYITGGIPAEFGNLTNLVTLDLGNNSLIDQIPSSLGNLKNLRFLTLSQNHLTGSIPETLSTLPSLINLFLDSNNLSGQIPEQLFQVSKFKYVELLNTIKLFWK